MERKLIYLINPNGKYISDLLHLTKKLCKAGIDTVLVSNEARRYNKVINFEKEYEIQMRYNIRKANAILVAPLGPKEIKAFVSNPDMSDLEVVMVAPEMDESKYQQVIKKCTGNTMVIIPKPENELFKTKRRMASTKTIFEEIGHFFWGDLYKYVEEEKEGFKKTILKHVCDFREIGKILVRLKTYVKEVENSNFIAMNTEDGMLVTKSFCDMDNITIQDICLVRREDKTIYWTGMNSPNQDTKIAIELLEKYPNKKIVISSCYNKIPYPDRGEEHYSYQYVDMHEELVEPGRLEPWGEIDKKELFYNSNGTISTMETTNMLMFANSVGEVFELLKYQNEED